jgi:S1-C subfamily serine protease
MARNQVFVRSSDMQGFAPALIDGKPAVNAYNRLIAHIAATAGPEAVTLFAEPQLPRGWSGGAGTISWYSSLQGRVVPLDALDHGTRSQFDQKVAARLRMLAPALADPALGPAVSTWLNIGGSGDILSVGGEPVLVNWGAAPSNVLTREQRAAHYAATLGQFAPQLPVPAGEAVLPPPVRPTQTSPAPGSGTGSGIDPRPRPPAQAAMSGSTAASAAPSAALGTAQASPVSPAAAVTMQPAVRTSRRWTAPWIATSIAAVVLLLLSLPGVLVYPAPAIDTSARDTFEQQRLRASNESLEAQLRAIQAALDGNQCRPANLVLPVPDLPSDSSGDDGDKPSGTPQLQVQPPAPEKAQLPPGERRGREDATTVGGLLEKTTVLIVAFSSSGENASMGTGFLISNRHVVTNHHVVQHVDASRVFVANKALGGVVPARIVALTQPPPTETDIGTDIAVLEIEPQAGLTGLALGPTPAKLSTAYVAGYPGFLTRKDSAFKSFLTTLARGAFSRDDIRQSMARDHIELPGVDLEEGRINNSMRTGSRSLPILLHDMQLAKGNSGGPLVDACGRLIGINTALFPSDAGTRQGNVAQDVAAVRGFLTEKGIAFVDEPQACAPQVAAAPAASPAPTAVKP